MYHVAALHYMGLIPPSNVAGTMTLCSCPAQPCWGTMDHITQTCAPACSTRLRAWDHYVVAD